MTTLRRPDKPTLGTQLHTRGNQTITVAKLIVEQIAAGSPPEHAALAAGLTRADFNALMREGTTQLARYQAGADWSLDFGPDQRDAALFAQEVQRAAGEYASSAVLLLERLARGGETVTTERVKRAGDGTIVERVTTTETLLPDKDVLRWRLERMFPTVYGSRQHVDLTVQDMTDGPDVREVISERLLSIAQRYEGALEASVSDETASEG